MPALGSRHRAARQCRRSVPAFGRRVRRREAHEQQPDQLDELRHSRGDNAQQDRRRGPHCERRALATGSDLERAAQKHVAHQEERDPTGRCECLRAVELREGMAGGLAVTDGDDNLAVDLEIACPRGPDPRLVLDKRGIVL